MTMYLVLCQGFGILSLRAEGAPMLRYAEIRIGDICVSISISKSI